jgi:hypothetical protein
MAAFISYHDFALAQQYIKHVLGKRIMLDHEYHSIKYKALVSLPEDQQTPLKDVVPSTLSEDYPTHVKEIAENILAEHEKKCCVRA